ncbi:MAG: hypothetical protein K1X88_22400 [Nannocystaceae bacterium]|nr:hypothetical protein [Nannocystaceae bacterium]
MPLAGMLEAGLFAARLFAAGSAAIAPPGAVGPELPPPPPRPADYALRWEAPPECPSAETIAARVQALARDPTGGSGTAFVQAQVEATAAGYRLVLATEFLGNVETRVLEAEQCDALADATALVIAVTLQPALATVPPVRDAEPEPPPEPATPEPDARPEPLPPPEPARPRRAVPVQALLRAAALGEWGSLPGPSGGAAVAIGVAWPRIRAELEAMWVAPRSTPRRDGRSATVQLAGGTARACYRVWVRSVELPVCAGLEAAAAIARPQGTRSTDRRVGPSVGPKIGVGVARQFRTVGVFAAVEAVGRAYGTSLSVDGTRLFTQAPVSGRLWLGVELHLPPRPPVAGPKISP